jgi:hypothetical protein
VRGELCASRYGAAELARLLKRVFELDLEHCPNCGGELRIIAAILEQPVIEKISRTWAAGARGRRLQPVGRRSERLTRTLPIPQRSCQVPYASQPPRGKARLNSLSPRQVEERRSRCQLCGWQFDGLTGSRGSFPVLA